MERPSKLEDLKILSIQKIVTSANSAFNDLILNLELEITKADIAFNAPLLFNASIKAGPITVADMFNLYKYENNLCTMRCW